MGYFHWILRFTQNDVYIFVILNDSEDNSEGECCDHACMDITEPQSWGLAPPSQF